MPVIRTFASHATVDKPRVHEILRRSAPFGVRPWIDDHDLSGAAGKSLHASITEAIQSSCRSLSLFLTEAAVRSGWVGKEVAAALPKVPAGWRVIPIALDPLDQLVLPDVIEAALRARGNSFDTLYLDPADPHVVERFAAAVLAAGGADEAPEIVLSLGHRLAQWEASVPEPWEHLPVLDLRLAYPWGHKDFSPSDAEWNEIRSGVDFLHRRLRKVERIILCGMAPLGVAAAIGTAWDRGTGVRFHGWNQATRRRWSGELKSAQEQLADRWSPETSRLVEVKGEGNFYATHVATVAFIQREPYENDVRDWHAGRNPDATDAPLLFAKWPFPIQTSAEATAVLVECLGVIHWIRRTYPKIREMDLIATLPLPLVAFLAHHLRNVGVIRFHDEVKPPATPRYRLAVSWS